MRTLQKYFFLVTIFFLPMVTLMASASISDQTSNNPDPSSYYEPDKRFRVRSFQPTHSFEFIAINVCNETYQQCTDLWGGGTYNVNTGQVAAQGNYDKYMKDTGFVIESAWWSSLDFVSASEQSVIFKAQPGVVGAGLAGFIVLEVFEGGTAYTGKVCVYGNLFDKQKPSSKEDADCITTAYVKIDPI
jgi:hypothetical protein